MPKCACRIDSRQTPTGAHVYIFRQPRRRLLVPTSRHFRNIGSCLKFNDVNIVGSFPSDFFSFRIIPIEACIPDVLCTFGVLPSEIILLANRKQTSPCVEVTNVEWKLQKFLGKNVWGVILRISRVEQRKFGTKSQVNNKVHKTGDEGNDNWQNVARNPCLSIRCLENATID